MWKNVNLGVPGGIAARHDEGAERDAAGRTFEDERKRSKALKERRLRRKRLVFFSS